jgi:hypothetical protein
MNPMDRHPSMYRRSVATEVPNPCVGQVVHVEDAADGADCCSARPLFLVLLAASDTRPEPAELLLCGHHRRVSRDALNTAHAAVYDLSTALG